MDGEKILNHSQRVGKPDTLQKGGVRFPPFFFENPPDNLRTPQGGVLFV